jgi:hypothetical protein
VSAAPLKAKFKPVPSKAVTETISAAKGGKLRLTAPGRVGIVVKIPPAALLADTRVTATPIQRFRVAPVHGGFVAGVQLAPEGLALLKPGSVEFRPRKGLKPARRYFLGSHGDGSDVYLAPPAFRKVGRGRKAKLRVVSKPIVPILHFSTVEGFDWSKANLRDLDAIRYPKDEINQVAQDIALLLGIERQRQFLGLETGLPLEELAKTLERARDQVIKPRLVVTTAALTRRCSLRAIRDAREALLLALAFVRQEQLLGFPDSFTTAKLMGPLLKAMANCMLEQCARYGPRLVQALVVTARQVELIGASASQAFYDALFRNLVECSKGEVHIDSTIVPEPETPGQEANTTYSMHVDGRAPFEMSFEGSPVGRWIYKDAPLKYLDAHGGTDIFSDDPECGTYFYRDTLSVNSDGVFKINQLTFNQIDPSQPDTTPPIENLFLTITQDPTEYRNVLVDCEGVKSSGVIALWASYFGYLHLDPRAPANVNALSFNGPDFIADAAPVIALAIFADRLTVYFENTLVEVISKPGPVEPLPDPFENSD